LGLSVCAWFAVSAAAFGADPAPVAATDEVSFRQAVWPLLKRHCWGCHSAAKPEGGLAIDTVAAMLKGGDSGPLFEPGKSDESLLVKMITGERPEMPQKQPPLSAEKVELLRRWVAGGAKDDSMPGDAAPAIKIPASYKFPVAITSVALSPDGKLAAAACRSEVVLVEVDGEAAPRRLPTECDLLTHVEFSPDGSLLAAAGGTPGSFGELRFFKVADGSVIGVRRIGHDTLFRGSFAPDGKAIALGSPEGAVYVVPLDPAAEPRRYELHSDWALDVAYTPDGKMLVSGGRDKATKVSSAETGQLLRALDASPEAIGSVAASNEFAVSAGRARTLIGFEFKIALQGVEVAGGGNGAQPVNRRDQYAKPFEGPPQAIYDLAASRDGKLLAAAGAFGEARVYQIADRQRIATIPNLPIPIYAIALDAVGARLAVGGKNGQLQVFELPSGKPLKSLVPVPVEAPAK
jgi:WD40 repeat protein